MTTNYIAPETEEHWLEMRAKDITSTESAALFGMSPYITELELFYRKRTSEIIHIEENKRMTAGKYLEPSIAELAGNELSCTVRPFKIYATDPDEGMGSSFDYEIVDGQYKDWILEVKNVDFLVYRDQWEDDEAPDHIEVQVQHQLELTGRPGAVIACLVGGNDLKLIMRPRNKKMGAGIRQRIQKFWRDVESNNPPDPDYMKDSEFIISLHQSSGDNTLDAEDDPKVTELIKEYKRLKDEAKDISKIADARKAELLDLIGDNVSKVVSGLYTLSCGMTKDTPPTTITAEMIGQEYGGRKGYRNFRVNKKKEQSK